jgi:hypothetical protein
MCSTPQKHPAAIVTRCAPSGRFIGVAGALEVDMLRKKREMKDIEGLNRTPITMGEKNEELQCEFLLLFVLV